MIRTIRLPLLLLAVIPVICLADQEKIAIASVAQMYTPSGAVNNNWLGGGSSQAMLFDGTTTTGVCMPEWGTDGRRSWPDQYMVFDLETLLPGGYFVSKIEVWQENAFLYSLYYSSDGGLTYDEVENGINVSSSNPDGAAYSVGKIATQVKIVFHELSGYSGGTSEIAVWGEDPSKMGCKHPLYSEWEAIPGTSTCTKPGTDKRKCQSCGLVDDRASELLPPLGHDYVQTLVQPGTSSSFGVGSITCARCGHSIVFNRPLDLVTLGGVAGHNLVQFTDLSVSSTGDASWSGHLEKLIDGSWSYDIWKEWHAASRSHDEWVQFDFGDEIELTAIDFVIHDHTQTVEFYKVEEGIEDLIGEVAWTGTGATDDSASKRLNIDFRCVTLRTLRVRVSDSIGLAVNGSRPIGLGEIHPYGTVKGAGKLDVRRSRIILY